MKKLGEFFKTTKSTPKPSTPIEKNQEIQIQIEGNIGLFKDEKEKIIEGAKQLLEIGKTENMEDAIITAAVMLRGLKFNEIKTTKHGKIIILRETATENVDMYQERD